MPSLQYFTQMNFRANLYSQDAALVSNVLDVHIVCLLHPMHLRDDQSRDAQLAAVTKRESCKIHATNIYSAKLNRLELAC